MFFFCSVSYEEDPLPAFQTYVPGETDRAFRVGAVEEESFRPQKTLQELDQSEQAQLARVQHQRYAHCNDKLKPGTWRPNEFLFSLSVLCRYIAEEEKDAARRAFQKYDKDGSGSIDAAEMAMVLSDLGVVNLDDDDPVRPVSCSVSLVLCILHVSSNDPCSRRHTFSSF